MIDLNELLSSWLNLVFDYVRSLVNYKIADGVNFFCGTDGNWCFFNYCSFLFR